MKTWLLVEARTHRVKRAPDGSWGAYCPMRGVDYLIYAPHSKFIFELFDTPCPHIDGNMRPLKMRERSEISSN